MMNFDPTHDTFMDLRQRIFRIERLGAMPQIVWRLVEALGDPNTNALRLEKLILGDPGLASKILSLANSAYYGLPRRVATISHAIVVLGFQELQIMVIGAGLAQMFDLSRAPAGFDADGFWSHCLSVSWASRELALAAGYVPESEIMAAGLLHDLGKLILATHMQTEFAEILDRTAAGVPFFKAEDETGIRHTTIGFWLARRWGLPGIYEAVIRDHHLPLDTGPYNAATAFVFLADGLVKELGIGLIQQSRPADRNTALKAAGLTIDQVEEVRRKAEAHLPSMLGAWQALLDRKSHQ